MIGKFGTAAILATTTSQLSLETFTGVEKNAKFGLCCYSCEEQHYTPLTKIANWTYNYRLYPHSEFPIEWAQENDVEFVAMIHQRDIFLDSNWKKCGLNPEKTGSDPCTVDQLVGVLEDTMATLNTNYLMGFNEPY